MQKRKGKTKSTSERVPAFILQTESTYTSVHQQPLSLVKFPIFEGPFNTSLFHNFSKKQFKRKTQTCPPSPENLTVF